MKNLSLTFVYVHLNNNQHLTFVTTDPNDVYEELNKLSSLSLLPIHFTHYEEKYTIGVKKDKDLYLACIPLFCNIKTLKYDFFLYFNNDIHKRSFVKEVLLPLNKYQPKNKLESYLFSLNILYAYYQNKITFFIKNEYKEISYSFGSRIFNKEYQTKILNYEEVIEHKTKSNHSDVYRSYSTSKLIKIIGLNDNGLPISLLFND